MTAAFRPGDRVIARYDGDGGWYNGEIVRLDEDGFYLVRWTPTPRWTTTRGHTTGFRPLPVISPVDPEDIRRQTQRGPYSAGF